MTVNRELMTQILGYVDTKSRNEGIDQLPVLDGYTSEEIGYHVKLAVEYGYLSILRNIGGQSVITGLTTLGMQV